MNYIITWLISLVTLSVIDAVWLLVVAKTFYVTKIGHLMAASPSFAPILIFYPLYAVGLSLFVINPSLAGNYSLAKVCVLGFLFGLVAYAAYDLTNQATLRDWPVVMTVVDMLWGASLSLLTSVITVYIVRYFL